MLTLNRDYRFDPRWTYGLPGNLSHAAFSSGQDKLSTELVDRSTIAKANRIANPVRNPALSPELNSFLSVLM